MNWITVNTDMFKINSYLLFQIISVISISFVVVSTIGMTLNTMPSIRVKHEGMDESIDNPKLALIEAVCISWFTIEYLLRLAGKRFSYGNNDIIKKKIQYLVTTFLIVYCFCF